jgi:CRP/FNR family transcriptional regulator, cyclic AMP receptor protein
MHWTDLIHSLAGLLIVASASSRTMVPLRILAIATNCFLIICFSVLHAWLPMLLQAAALPLNAWRLYQMLMLVSRVREAVRGKPSLDWLKPFMSERHFRKGDLLFAKGETADEMFYTMTGRYILVELGVETFRELPWNRMPGQ